MKGRLRERAAETSLIIGVMPLPLIKEPGKVSRARLCLEWHAAIDCCVA